jgi:hypothetical protein
LVTREAESEDETEEEDAQTNKETPLMIAIKKAFDEDDVLVELMNAKITNDRRPPSKTIKKRFKIFMKRLTDLNLILMSLECMCLPLLNQKSKGVVEFCDKRGISYFKQDIFRTFNVSHAAE